MDINAKKDDKTGFGATLRITGSCFCCQTLCCFSLSDKTSEGKCSFHHVMKFTF